VTPVPIPTLQRESAPALPIGEHTRVVALLGLDRPRSAAIWRTDSMILVFINQDAGRVGLLPMPRDLWVYIPGHGYGRINTVDAMGERANGAGGGLALLDQTLRENLGVPVDHYVRVDFSGFTRLIDAVGGVTVDVEAPIGDTFPDPNSPTGTFEMTLEAGPQYMDGQTALAYCRSRWSTSDLDRGQRQRQVLLALWEQAFTVETLAQAPHLWATFEDAFQTDLTLGQAVQLAYLVQGIEAQDVRTKSMGWDEVRSWTTSQGARVLLPQTEAIQRVILELLDGSG
jgi:LCP family protein required for cell wall assembly